MARSDVARGTTTKTWRDRSSRTGPSPDTATGSDSVGGISLKVLVGDCPAGRKECGSHSSQICEHRIRPDKCLRSDLKRFALWELGSLKKLHLIHKKSIARSIRVTFPRVPSPARNAHQRADPKKEAEHLTTGQASDQDGVCARSPAATLKTAAPSTHN
jgi:hypothetical protein